MRRLRIRERAYDVNLATTEKIHYEALLDEALADFFSAPSVQRHLIRQGIIKPTGEVVDPKEFKCHQIEMDAHERELAVRRRQEEQTLNREVEV
ncbi:MAG: hypothetical protein BJ554DRAFT_1718 [Olpidium bornovanus]|uniref:Uncharacterized protein n=1 Tax=Olpidium bornovanus TaxID=278681 RepID=A0A8H8DGV9_9FUNG|nr:MAG: hypothetical protein BJ554DRAFT_1718 [Olpidium bornovanus]